MTTCTFVGWFVWERALRTVPGEGPVVCGAAQFLLVWEGSFLPVLSGFMEHECASQRSHTSIGDQEIVTSVVRFGFSGGA